MGTQSHKSDRFLLGQYIEHNSQEAFDLLVTRHLNMVYATCRRELGEAILAEDTTQAVFLILARKAPALRSEVHLAGWLFQTARFAAQNTRTREARRKQYERKAAQIMAADQIVQNDILWKRLETSLNDAVARLSADDREAILLRYWDNRSLAETGEALGVSEDAARKRVARALEKLRGIIGKQGVVVSSVELASLLSNYAPQAAPVHITAAIDQTAISTAAGHVTNSSPSLLSEKIMRAVTIAQVKMAAIVIAAMLAGLGAYSAVVGSATRQVAITSAAIRSREVRMTVSPEELKTFTRKFADRIDAGQSLVSTFTELAAQQSNPPFRQVIEQINQDLQKGDTLSGAMGKYPEIFSQDYVQSIRHAERTGTLEDSLHQLANE